MTQPSNDQSAPALVEAVTNAPQPAVRRKPWATVAVGVTTLIIGIGIGAAATNGSKGEPAATAATPTKSATAAPPRAAVAATTSAPTYGQPTPRDFKVGVKILEKKCFGSAGCNITYEIDPTYTGILPLDPSTTYRVTYEVRGVEDGPAVNTFEVTGDTASLESEETGSTASSKAKLTARVTDVVEE